MARIALVRADRLCTGGGTGLNSYNDANTLSVTGPSRAIFFSTPMGTVAVITTQTYILPSFSASLAQRYDTQRDTTEIDHAESVDKWSRTR